MSVEGQQLAKAGAAERAYLEGLWSSRLQCLPGLGVVLLQKKETGNCQPQAAPPAPAHRAPGAMWSLLSAPGHLPGQLVLVGSPLSQRDPSFTAPSPHTEASWETQLQVSLLKSFWQKN